MGRWKAKGVVVFAGIVTAIMVGGFALLNPDDERVTGGLPRAALGGFGLVIMLALLADVSPEVASSLATLMAVAVVLALGPDVIGPFTQAVGGSQPAPAGITADDYPYPPSTGSTTV